ncbi:MAG: STAS domain-containing protein [Planctomycetes bacterium]|nr:STAS domain-containing protein [Planctomycetota bacterium]
MSDEISQEELDEMADKLQFSVEDSPDFQVFSRISPEGLPLITITGRVLGVEAASLTDRVCNRYAAVKGNILMDLHECSFFSSIALGFIYNLADQRKKMEGTLVVIGAGQQIRKMVYMMGMGEYFSFVDTFEEALAFDRGGK